MKRADAIKAGASIYFTGKPCKHGHICERETSSGNCIECKRVATKIWRSQNPTVMRKRRQEWAKANPQKIKEYSARGRRKALARTRIRKGLPLPTRETPAVCEICLQPDQGKSLALDHCHKSGVFRGWLCSRCNLGLSMFKDNPEAFLAAFRYLAQVHMPHIELIELTPEQAAAQGLQ